MPIARNYTTLWARSVDGKNLGLVFTDGQCYWNQKTFCVKHLKGFGFGKSSMMETVMVEQANLLADTLIKKNGGHIEINNKLVARASVTYEKNGSFAIEVPAAALKQFDSGTLNVRVSFLDQDSHSDDLYDTWSGTIEYSAS